MKYEIIEHTGDVGIIVHGSTYEELFSSAVWATADIIVDIKKLGKRHTKEVQISSANFESLLVDLLSEIILSLEVEGTLYYDAKVSIDRKSKSLKGTLKGGEVTDDADYRYVIKAPTYHMIEVSPEKGFARVIFDV